MDRDEIRRVLLKRYIILLAPAGLAMAVWAAYRNLVTTPTALAPEATGPVAFIGAAATALALPLLIRDRFVRKVSGLRFVETGPFVAFEKSLLAVSLVSAYFAALAYVCSVSMFHFGGSVLAALYAAYYYFPSDARVAHEMRLFRVGNGTAADGA